MNETREREATAKRRRGEVAKEDAQVRVRNPRRSVTCITEGAKVLKIGAHLRAALPASPIGVEVFDCQIAMRVRTRIPTFSQQEKERGKARLLIIGGPLQDLIRGD